MWYNNVMEYTDKYFEDRTFQQRFLNDAQALVDLEEAGTFDFFDLEKLENLLEETGWDIIRTVPTFGEPPQGYVMIAQARDTNGKERSIF